MSLTKKDPSEMSSDELETATKEAIARLALESEALDKQVKDELRPLQQQNEALDRLLRLDLSVLPQLFRLTFFKSKNTSVTHSLDKTIITSSSQL